MKKNHLFTMLILLLIIIGCNQNNKKKALPPIDSLQNKALEEWNRTIPGNFSGQTDLNFDSTALTAFFNSHPDFKIYEDNIRTFYNNRSYNHAWFDHNGLIEQAGNLADRMLNLQNEGINQKLPYDQTLDSLLSKYDHQQQKDILDLELMLTAQYFAFAHFAWQGLDTTISKANDWFVPRKKVAYELYLDSMLKQPLNKRGASIEPVYRQYEQLRTYLLQYRQLDAVTDWPIITSDKKSYKIGDSAIAIGAIKKRLHKLQDYTGDTTTNIFDSVLFKAVRNFQGRHGLENDGAIGPSTMAALNVSIQERIKQIIVNMERSRWLPVSLKTDYLAVNIPEFKLHVYNADSLLWSCNVVVGKAVHKTVIFHGDIKYVVFSPYWNVPPSIVRNEILPGIRKDPKYITKHNMEITGNSGGLPTVRQKPGPKNSLGLVKFLFPNSYNIYLHDSPAKSLYNQASRAFSHGCIRVSEPDKLANFLLKNDSSWTKETIYQAMHAGKEKYVTLKQPVPVYIAYFTAFIDREGKINFRDDIYDRDRRLASMLIAEK
ncbi:L,D-transpeptidase family protein [Olivibacter sp. SDN3]|uniref:L,D-transpeptidase family protein n=1 Tax=Olivibacter sp. SDN3 TaxID=2764720 RepID=UPI001651326B|nr:L,D-transpeptidase family protein [Olivibacter sp. SDN3]QNL50391.1 L,D-transpeptidase family protein [Olivibacter sp. SDN3]